MLQYSNSNSAEQCGGAACETVHYSRPTYRIQDTETAFLLSVDVPGAKKSGVELSVEDGVLEVRARREENLDTRWRPLRRESAEAFAYGLRLQLGDSIEIDGISAETDAGVLLVTLPKAERKRPRRIDVN